MMNQGKARSHRESDIRIPREFCVCVCRVEAGGIPGRRHCIFKGMQNSSHIVAGTKGDWWEEAGWSYTVKTLLLPEWQFELSHGSTSKWDPN